MFPTPQTNKAEYKMEENFLSLLDDDELKSVENEIITKINTNNILRKRNDFEMNNTNEEDFNDEKVELTEWFEKNISQIVKLKILKFHTIKGEKIDEMLNKAEEEIQKFYGDDIFSISEDAEVESQQLGNF